MPGDLDVATRQQMYGMHTAAVWQIVDIVHALRSGTGDAAVMVPQLLSLAKSLASIISPRRPDGTIIPPRFVKRYTVANRNDLHDILRQSARPAGGGTPAIVIDPPTGKKDKQWHTWCFAVVELCRVLGMRRMSDIQIVAEWLLKAPGPQFADSELNGYAAHERQLSAAGLAIATVLTYDDGEAAADATTVAAGGAIAPPAKSVVTTFADIVRAVTHVEVKVRGGTKYVLRPQFKLPGPAVREFDMLGAILADKTNAVQASISDLYKQLRDTTLLAAFPDTAVGTAGVTGRRAQLWRLIVTLVVIAAPEGFLYHSDYALTAAEAAAAAADRPTLLLALFQLLRKQAPQ